MKTMLQIKRLATAKITLAVLLCLILLLAIWKKDAPPARTTVQMRLPLVGLREDDIVVTRTEARNDREANAALEKEERELVEAIIAARASSVPAEQTESLRNALRSLDLAARRYPSGTGGPDDVTEAQQSLAEARGSYLDALRKTQVAHATLIRATGEEINPETLSKHP